MIDSIMEMVKLIALMIFVSSVATQGWIAFLDIIKYFTNKLEKYRPQPSQDKYSRIAIIIGVLVVFSN